jgi:phosphomannomutase/phosphoglucomutase
MNPTPTLFRKYDIRGIYDKELNPDVAFKIGLAYGTYILNKHHQNKKVNVVVGRDNRLSSPSLKEALIKGLTGKGLNVIDLGICPTPLLYFSLFTLKNVSGGIMITGSHNPPSYNGFKMCIGKRTIYGKEIENIKKLAVAGIENPIPAKVSSITYLDISSKYIKEVVQRTPLLSDSRIKVAVDAGNGTAGPLAIQILSALNCEVVPIYCNPDGNFPNHHPDPSILENLEDLRKTVIEKKCDLGIAFDGDADRLGVVDERGEVVWGDKLMILFAKDILNRYKKGIFIGEVKCSQIMYDEIEKLGGEVIMWKTGHSLIKDKMKKEKALLAGEMSGHFFFADNYYGYDDAIYAACRLISILKKEKKSAGKSLGKLLEEIPKTYNTPEIRIECEDEKKFEILEEFIERIENEMDKCTPKIVDLITIDGVRIKFENGWGLVRASNTQPALVLRFEGYSPKALQEIQSFVMERLSRLVKLSRAQ